MGEQHTEHEQQIRAAFEAGDFQVAATRALEAYGHEINTFLCVRMRNGQSGDDAFSMFVEDFWKGLPSFRYECSMRVWMYTLARNASNRYGSAAHRRREHNLTPALRESLSALVDRARSETQVHLRTAVKDRLREFREQLAPDDRMLLVLHVDRALPWRDVAIVMAPDGERLAPDELEREAARLRKRFERVKAELKAIVKREGLLRK